MRLILTFLLALGFGLVRPLAALETDQFTPPPRPLMDLGREFDREVAAILQEVADRVNTRYREHLARTPAWPSSFKRAHLNKAKTFLSEAYLTKTAFLALSRSGTPQNRMEAFFRYGDFDPNTSLFRLRANDSVYGSFKRPITIQTLSPTIRLHDVYLGTDKLGHFFEQGYEYYEAYAAELNKSHDVARALRKAIARGVQQENTYYGMMVDGVYSNADLAANFSGLLFYLNLTHPLTLDGVTHAPMLRLENERWVVNRDVANPLSMRPFVADHFNEALNPSRFSRSLRTIVKQSVRELSEEWLEFYGLTPEQYRERSRKLESFFGHFYGHSSSNTVTPVASAG